MAGLVLGVLLPSVRSLAVTVALPTVLSVTLKVFVPDTNAALGGKVAPPDEEERPTVSLMVSTRFQLASTLLTVTLKGVPAACGLGVPVLPVGVPGAAVSPGTSNWSLLKTAELTAKVALTALVRPLLVAVSCLPLPAVSIWRSVKATVPLPAAEPISSVLVPDNVPLPEVSVTVTSLLAGNPAEEKLPNRSWVLSTGWMPKGTPALAEPGWVAKTSRSADAGPTTIGSEVTLVRLVALN